MVGTVTIVRTVTMVRTVSSFGFLCSFGLGFYYFHVSLVFMMDSIVITISIVLGVFFVSSFIISRFFDIY